MLPGKINNIEIGSKTAIERTRETERGRYEDKKNERVLPAEFRKEA
jgi:hypothetical protein